MLALSVITVNTDLSKQILFDEIAGQTTRERAPYVVNVVNKLIVHSQTVKDREGG